MKRARSTAGLMVGEKLRAPHVSRRRPRLREFADTAQEVGPVHGRMRTKSFESEPRAKLRELKGAIERMGDLVRRYCGRRDAQGNPHTHTLADDFRMRSFGVPVTVRPRHLQVNRARLT